MLGLLAGLSALVHVAVYFGSVRLSGIAMPWLPLRDADSEHRRSNYIVHRALSAAVCIIKAVKDCGCSRDDEGYQSERSQQGGCQGT